MLVRQSPQKGFLRQYCIITQDTQFCIAIFKQLTDKLWHFVNYEIMWSRRRFDIVRWRLFIIHCDRRVCNHGDVSQFLSWHLHCIVTVLISNLIGCIKYVDIFSAQWLLFLSSDFCFTFLYLLLKCMPNHFFVSH